MFKNKWFTGVTLIALAGLVLLMPGVFSALAAAPTNDDFDGAIVIPTLPFTSTTDTTEAIMALDDPGFGCSSPNNSVWYAFTPSGNMSIQTSTNGSSYTTSIAVFTGTRGSLSQVASICNSGSIRFAAAAGVTYYFMINSSGGGPYPPPTPGGTLVFNVSQVLSPPNDNFADATQISSLPFNVNQDTTGATFEADELYPSCGFGYPLKTAWFAYTPPTDVTLTAIANYIYFPTLLAVYTGGPLNNLSQVSCSNFNSNLTFQAQAGVTYYIQISGLFGDEGTIQFSLEVTPPPNVFITYNPSDPSTFDNVSISTYYNDPGGIYGFTYAWTISDGTTSDLGSFNHQFATDGDYTVNLIATTSDGRSGSASQVVRVRTHDVAITRFSVPQTARVNQTKTINVDLKNNRYSEDVQVTLYKGLPGGGEQVIGTLTLYVPARSNRATTFKFSYTFTPDDATVGKVTFRVAAAIVNVRDALPSDNISIASTTVSR